MRFRCSRYRKYHLLSYFALLLGIILSGCGGGGGSNPISNSTPTPTPTPTATVTPPASPVAVRAAVIWGPRSRAIVATNGVGGPSSALSAKITIPGANNNGGDIVLTVNRSVDSGREEYSSAPTLAKPGAYTLNAQFFADTNGNGAVVGNASAGITIQADGSISTTITTFGTIQSVEIPANQMVNLGQTKKLVYTPKDSAGNVVAVTPGSAFITVVANPDKLTVQGENVTGVAPNRATVQVRIDEAVSPNTDVIIRSAAAITVGPNPAVVSIGQPITLTANVANDGPAGSNGVTYTLLDSAGGTLAQSDSLSAIFTAGQGQGTYNVLVRSNYDPDITVTIPVQVGSQIAVSISPNPATVGIKDMRQFTATVANVPSGGDTGVIWSVVEPNAGTIDQTGKYTAPATAGTYTVRATSKYDATKFADVQVTVQSFVSITVVPNPNPGGSVPSVFPVSIKSTQAFTVSVNGVPTGGDTNVTWSVTDANGNPTTAGGSITPGGVYTAPDTPGTFRIVARSNFDPNVTGFLTVQVTSGVALALAPNPVTVSVKGTQQFTPTISGVAAGGDTGVNWTVVQPNGGSISATGLYTAPATPGTYTVRATSRFDPTVSATATVNVVANVTIAFVSPDTTPIVVNPTTGATVVTRKFTATVAGVPAGGDTSVTYTVETPGGGTIAPDGTYTPPRAPLAADLPVTIRATSNFYSDLTANPQVGVARVTFTLRDPIAVTTNITSATLSVNSVAQPNLVSQAFTVTVTGVPAGGDTGYTLGAPNGGTVTAITGGGVFTPPTTPGTYRVVVASNYDPTRTATITFTVVSNVSVSSITGPDTLIPNPATGNPVVTGTYVATLAGIPAGGDTGVTWSVTGGGNIDAVTGVYTPPRAPLAAPLTVTITATSKFNPAIIATKTVTVTSAPISVDVSKNPTAALTVKGVRSLSATVLGLPVGAGVDTSVRWDVVDASGNILTNGTNGTVTAAGVYTAPATPGNYRVRATSNYDPSKSATIIIPVQSGTGVIVVN